MTDREQKQQEALQKGKWFENVKVKCGDALAVLKTIPDGVVQCAVTGPPYYGLRDYGIDGQIGLEDTVDDYRNIMVRVFREVRRILKPDGILWLNLADSYAGSGKGRLADGSSSGGPKQRTNKGTMVGKLKKTMPPGYKPKDVILTSSIIAEALRVDGWYLRSCVTWVKPNPMPESMHDRPTRASEMFFLLSKNGKYTFYADAIKENAKSFVGKRNIHDVWVCLAGHCKGVEHFATTPKKLVKRCILSGTKEGDLVMDPFAGSGTTLAVAKQLGRRAIGIELNPQYVLGPIFWRLTSTPLSNLSFTKR